jgi:acyl-CoA thioesterase
MARLIQDGREVLRSIAVFGDLSTLGGPTHETLMPPALPPPEACDRGRAGPTTVLTIADRVVVSLRPGDVSWVPRADGTPAKHSDRAELAGWLEFADGRPVDATSLVFLADALPPPVLNLAVVRTPWVPTLELTVHVRRRPAPGPVRVRFQTRELIGGYLEEDGEIWDATGALVAMSRQLARVQRAS